VTAETRDSQLALVLTGGGARGAYQVGMLRYLARRYPQLRIPILTGVSAGAVNAAHLAQHQGTFGEAVADLTYLWRKLRAEHVFRVDAGALSFGALRWFARLVSGGLGGEPRTRGLVDTSPLSEYLERALSPENGTLTGIAKNIQKGWLHAIAITSTDYTTGQSVVWVQGRDFVPWQRPNRKSVQTQLRLEHVLASSSLPFFFPAVQVGDSWHGDGGIRLTAPLSPALHLGARRILAVSTRYARTEEEANRPQVVGYPPPAQVLGVLYNAIFLDLIDQDVMRLQRANTILRQAPVEYRGGMQVVDILVIRPSRDLGKLAGDFEPKLPGPLRWMSRGLGTEQTNTPDFLSLIMFQTDYIKRLIHLGEEDAEARAADIDAFLAGGPGESGNGVRAGDGAVSAPTSEAVRSDSSG
jgi:NTE family protein